MKRAALLAVLWCVGVGWGWGQASEKKPDAAKPIAPLSWLVGGTWTADASKMAPGMRQIETRYRWSDNGAYIQFNTHFVSDEGTAKAYDGHFFWNPEEKSLAMWYMDPKNGITQGPVEVNGEVTKITFYGPDFEGKLADLQVIVTRKTNDDYHWAVSEKNGANWKELAALEYLRGS
jgi:hypothetical protein